MIDTFVHDLIALLPALRRYSNALVRNPDVAEDLVQATFLRALERRDMFAKGTTLSAWLITMARNLHLTNERVRRARLTRDGTYWSSFPCVSRPNQIDHLALGDVDRALDTLPRRQREMVLMVAFSGLRGKGLARAAGTSHQGAWNRLNRGRERLKELCA